MKREEAREYFKNKGLSYESLVPVDITQLAHLISMELIEYLSNGGEHAIGMDMKVATIRKKDINFKEGKFISAKVQVNGSYFKRREAVTFSQTGLIGFGGELDDKNVQPILKAFCKWCDELVDLCSDAAEYKAN